MIVKKRDLRNIWLKHLYVLVQGDLFHMDPDQAKAH